MVDGVSTKIVHSMLVRGATSPLLRFLSTAVMNTFNTHPRMRALQVKGERFMAEVHPPLTRHDVTSFALVRVRMISSVASDADDMMSGWQKYADDECSIGFDRFKQLSFFLTVWVDDRGATARLMLFSDSYMSDGFSGMVVLNGILEQVSMLSKDHSETPDDEPEPEPALQVQELPLRPPLYKMWLSKVAWAKPIVKSVVQVHGRQTFRNGVHNFKPLLPPRADQHHFRAPPKTSSTTALFTQGDVECMKKVVAKCEEEHVTVNEAMVGVVLLAFYHVTKERKSKPSLECFKLTADVGLNMRRQVPSPVEEDQVGMYTTVSSLNWLTSEGVDLQTMSFWELARRAKQEMEDKPKHTLAMALPTVLMDKKVNSQMNQSFLKGIYLPRSLTADVNVASVDRYPFETEHQVSQDGEALTVESLHVYHPLPHLASSATLFVTAVNSFNYSMAHKCENVVGEALFAAIVELCEGIDRIGSDEKLIDVLNRVELRYTGHDYTLRLTMESLLLVSLCMIRSCAG